MAETYGRRPSELLGLDGGSWEAYAFDAAALSLSDRIEEAVAKARSRGGSPGAVSHRVEHAVRRLLTTERERQAEEAWREQAQARKVELVWERPGDPSSLRAIVHEEPRR